MNQMTLDEAAELLSEKPTASTEWMSDEERKNGIVKMLKDLRRLSEQDGCIAAAWAYELLTTWNPNS